MTEYRPDKWLLIKINGNHPHYRVLGSWSGGYLDGDSWRLNSGIVRCEYDEETETLSFYGHTGSVYHCNKMMYGANMTGWGVANQISQDENTEVLQPTLDDILKIDWIIS